MKDRKGTDKLIAKYITVALYSLFLLVLPSIAERATSHFEGRPLRLNHLQTEDQEFKSLITYIYLCLACVSLLFFEGVFLNLIKALFVKNRAAEDEFETKEKKEKPKEVWIFFKLMAFVHVAISNIIWSIIDFPFGLLGLILGFPWIAVMRPMKYSNIIQNLMILLVLAAYIGVYKLSGVSILKLLEYILVEHSYGNSHLYNFLCLVPVPAVIFFFQTIFIK
eukprot:TRINITY_DN14143_c0_g2_i1.p1 TRINITY_DN14143_c0_g2~~TRINITY_DN14143_c0_g2_i1.p1  ORF type:complete len:222 (-),score=41.34 TRINITY_DN14143_c0_g2_i1:103-768(-)